MKTISVIVPCFNEEENVEKMCHALLDLFRGELHGYDYELIFIDNHSEDDTRAIIRRLCEENRNVRAIFNARNYGAFNSPVHALLQANGDCAIGIACDFQEPVELIPAFVKKWEEGAGVVAGVQSGSHENPFVYGLRSLYYKLVKAGSHLDYIEHFTGFGLYDRSFLEIVRIMDDPLPFIRGMVAEFGSNVEKVYYRQPRRERGKSHNGFFELYDAAMLSFTSYTGMGLRIMSLCGIFISVVSFIIGIVYLIRKLLEWETFRAGMAPVLIGMFFLGAVILTSIGFIGEYIISINRRVMHRPLVIEEERIGFDSRSGGGIISDKARYADSAGTGITGKEDRR